ncbi:Nucleoporin NDC1 [Microtus ochrogaster]|uniref:Nucleoporin NDC1 n=1 Tax=Microtus ochrogaster TaxID=79684 RepID=A0A8J6H0T8_MICOH|nr:Nucleoporin NDC1 [Microtus ochrogaster]
MQHRRPLLLAPRWTLLRKDVLNSRVRFLESQPPGGHVTKRQFWPVEPIQKTPRRDGLSAVEGSAQAVFRAAPAGSSRGLPVFEHWWRACTQSLARLRVGAAISMATAPSGPCVGGARDILWRVLGWRIVRSIIWSVLLLPVCTTAFIIFSSVDVFHPIQWLSDSFNDLCSSRVIFYLLLLSVVIIIISIFNVEFYTVVPTIPGSRLALIGRILHPQQLVHSFIHAAMGMVVAWCAAIITKGQYSFLVVPCTVTESLDSPAAQTCMNEHHLFFLLAGAFMGYSYSLLYFINNMNYLPFPIIQAYVFPVQPPFAEESDDCLPKVLNSSPPLIIKYLALQDLMLLSQYSPSRRQEVFSLSQPEETTFQTPKSSQMPSVPPLVKTSLFSPKLSTPDASNPFGTPFGSSVVNRMAGIFDVNTCYGSTQGPQLIRRGPRLWTHASDQQMSDFSNPSPCTSVTAERKTVRQPSVVYSWIQNKREQAVDKYFKLPHASSKPPRISGSLVDSSYKTLRFAFRASLKTAIYRIATTFGDHLNGRLLVEVDSALCAVELQRLATAVIANLCYHDRRGRLR